MENKAVKKRSKKFKVEETAVLVEEVEKRRALLFGPLKGPNLTQFHRDRGWQQVVDAVNAVAPTIRTAAELRSKFKDLKTRAKHRVNAVKREGRKTGGGQNEANTPLSAIDAKLSQFIGTDSIEGIAGGVDPFRRQVINPGPSTSTAHIPDVIIFDPNPVVPPSSTPILKPPPLPRRGKKRTIEAVLKEAEETTCLQRETNQILGELVSEMRQARSDLNSRLDQLINLKKLKLELLQEGIELKRKKLNIN
ncbi:hypothetical protein MTP99_003816 [Tenebrio molitor]|nr:hypothetical protein MTP99_003816 [Tenebrio molitor]